MKLALVGPCHPLRGGIAHYNARLFHALEAEGHKVRLYGMIRQYPSLLFPGRTQGDNSDKVIRAPADLVLDSTNPLSWRRTYRRIRDFQPQAAVFQWWHPYFAFSYGSIARFLRVNTDIQVIYLCHNARPHEATVLDDALLRFAYAPARGFLVHAQEEARRLGSFLADHPVEPRIKVAPHPVYDVFEPIEGLDREAARRQLGLTRPHQLLFFGYVRAYKGLRVLLEAMPSLLSDLDCELTVAGECYEDAQEYRRLIERLGLGDRVHFLDRYVSNEEVPVFFKAADLCVLPYIQATQSGIVQVAYALDTPVVVTRVGGIPEVVEDGVTGLLANPGDAASLAAAIRRFFAEDMAQPLIDGIRAKQAELSWSRIVENLVELIQ